MSETTIFLENCLQRLQSGDLQARDELIARASQRLLILTERMMKHYRRVARWEQVDDVFQQSVIRLHRCLETVVPASPEGFFRLAALQLRRELNSLASHYFGPAGLGTNQASSTNHPQNATVPANYVEPRDSKTNPAELSLWTEFHDAADQLPENEKKVFELLWYHGFSQREAAEIMQVNERQLRRYWHSARIRLNQRLGDFRPFA